MPTQNHIWDGDDGRHHNPRLADDDVHGVGLNLWKATKISKLVNLPINQLISHS